MASPPSAAFSRGISCEAAVWAQELELIAPQLIPRLNAALGGEAIRELRCRTA